MAESGMGEYDFIYGPLVIVTAGPGISDLSEVQ